MFEFFNQFGEAFSSIIDFFVGIIQYLVSFFKIITSSIGFLTDIVAVLPLPLKAAILCLISVSVIYLIVGRN